MFRLRTAACAAVAAFLLPLPAQAATLFNFELNGNYANAAGAGTITPKGGALAPGGYRFGANQGLTIDLGDTALGEYAIEVRFSFANTLNYRKIIDFAGGTLDAGLYNNSGRLAFFNRAHTNVITMAPDQLATVRLERTAAGLVTGYVNGQQQWTFTDAAGLAMFRPGRAINLFIDDGAVGGEASAGYVDYVRVFDTPTGTLPVGGVPEPSTWALLILGFGAVGSALRARRRPAFSIA